MNFRAALLVPMLALLLAAAPWPLQADDVSEAEARRLVERGELKPLSEILAAISAEFGGKVLEVELERDGPRTYTYEIEILTADGRVLELEYDARTGQRLKLEEEDDD
jgi:uncharacterized membrane protein YkoI